MHTHTFMLESLGMIVAVKEIRKSFKQKLLLTQPIVSVPCIEKLADSAFGRWWWREGSESNKKVSGRQNEKLAKAEWLKRKKWAYSFWKLCKSILCDLLCHICPLYPSLSLSIYVCFSFFLFIIFPHVLNLFWWLYF